MIWLARSSSSSVLSPIAETTTTTSSPFFLAATIRSATRFMCAADATEDPPYFWTTRATGPQATGVPAGDAAGCVPDARRDVIIRMDVPGATGCSAHEERGNPATDLPAWTAGNLAEPLVHGVAYFDRLVEEVQSLNAGDHLFFTDWRGDPDEQLRDGRPDGGRAVHRRGEARGLRPRAGVALAHGPDVAEQGGEPRARRRDRARRRRGDPRPADPPDGQPPPEVRRPAARRGPVEGRRVRRRDRPLLTAVATTPTTAATRRRCRWPQPTGRARRGTTCSWRSAARRCGVLDTVFRERWEDPNSPDADHPIAWIHDKLHHTRLHADPLPPQLAAAAGVRAALRADPAHLSGDPTAATTSRPDGERSVARGYTKAIKRARRLIYLEDQYMWSADVARLFAEALTDHPELHLVVVVPRFPDQDGAFAERPQLVGRWQAIEMCQRAGKDRVHVFDVENHDGEAGLRARQGLRRRRHLGKRRQRQLQPTLLDPRQRALQRRPRHDPRPPRAAGPGRHRARARALSPATCGWSWPASTSTWPDDGSEDDEVLDPDEFVATLDAAGRRPGRLARGRTEGPPAARSAASAPGRAAAVAHPARGPPRSTACSTTPTAARCGCG